MVAELEKALSSVVEECSGDDDPEYFWAELLSLNIGRTPGVMQFCNRFQTVSSRCPSSNISFSSFTRSLRAVSLLAEVCSVSCSTWVLASAVDACIGDADSERFQEERLSLNVGRTSAVTQFWSRFQMVGST